MRWAVRSNSIIAEYFAASGIASNPGLTSMTEALLLESLVNEQPGEKWQQGPFTLEDAPLSPDTIASSSSHQWQW